MCTLDCPLHVLRACVRPGLRQLPTASDSEPRLAEHTSCPNLEPRLFPETRLCSRATAAPRVAMGRHWHVGKQMDTRCQKVTMHFYMGKNTSRLLRQPTIPEFRGPLPIQIPKLGVCAAPAAHHVRSPFLHVRVWFSETPGMPDDNVAWGSPSPSRHTRGSLQKRPRDG